MEPAFQITHAATASVPEEQRIDYWQRYNRDALVDLKCSSLSTAGLDAEQTNYCFSNLKLADIAGNDHVIERDQRLIRSFHKEAVFACLMERGKAYFVQDGQCMTVMAGETVIYNVDRAYLYGFLCESRQFLLDMGSRCFTARTGLPLDRLPLKIGRDTRAGVLLNATLRRALADFVAIPDGRSESLEDKVYTLLGSMARCHAEDGVRSACAMAHLLMAKQFVDEHLGEPGLSPQEVAGALGISVRQLSRIFRAEGLAPAEYIWEQRAVRAHADLVDPRLSRLGVGEIAFRWGFSSQAHFSRTIQSRFGACPTRLRSAVAKSSA